MSLATPLATAVAVGVAVDAKSDTALACWWWSELTELDFTYLRGFFCLTFY